MNRIEIMKGRGAVWGVLVPLLLAAALFGIQYGPYQPITEETWDPGIYDALEAIRTGSALRQVSIVTLGLLGIAGLLRGRRATAVDGGSPGWALPLFLVLAAASILWAEDKALSGRRLVAFFMVTIGSAGFARSCDAEDMVSFALFAAAANLLLGAAAEIVSGTFHPFQKEYRFSGLMHPNSQAMNCSILFLSAAVSARGSREGRGRILLHAAWACAFLFLFLTKSRTSMSGAVLAFGAYWTLEAPPARRIALFLGIAWAACFSLLFLPDGSVFSFASNTLFPGRESTDVSNLTGRTGIWQACLSFIAARPLLGYGLGSFWTEGRIRAFEDAAGWGAGHGHSTYIDIALSLGIAGLLLYVLMLASGILRSARFFAATRSTGYGFLFAVLLYGALTGLLETAFPNPGFLTFTVLSGLMLLAIRPAAEDRGER